MVSLFPHPASFRFRLMTDTLAFGYPDVKGKGCKQPGFAALDIRFRRRYGREKAVSVRPLPPHTSFCCLHPRRTFTQNSG